jgi:hypothetical protein
MSDMEENRSLTGSPPIMDLPDTTDSSSESRTTPEPTDEEKAQRKLLEINLAKCLGQLGQSQRSIPVYPHKVNT